MTRISRFLPALLALSLPLACGPKQPTAGEVFASGAPVATPTPEGRLDGEALAADDSANRIFLRRVVFAIRDQFVPPRSIKPGDLPTMAAVVDLDMNGDGEITRAAIATSSGNPAFDRATLQAIHAAVDLPRPPTELAPELESKGVRVRFTADDAPSPSGGGQSE